jgi:hypothetical protein
MWNKVLLLKLKKYLPDSERQEVEDILKEIEKIEYRVKRLTEK